MEDVEVLTRNSQCDYAWVKSSNGDVVPKAVSLDHGFPVYIGRLQRLVLNINQTKVGKVGTRPPNNRMYYSFGDSETTTQKNYEVLVCNQKKNSSEVAPEL